METCISVLSQHFHHEIPVGKRREVFLSGVDEENRYIHHERRGGKSISGMRANPTSQKFLPELRPAWQQVALRIETSLVAFR